MNLSVNHTDSIRGVVKASPSKSYTHRAILVGSMSGRTVISNPLMCDDTRHTIRTCKRLGARITRHGNTLIVRGFDAGRRLNGPRHLNVGESGTLLRFVLPILAYGKGIFTVTGEGTLKARPNKAIVEVLRAWGVNIEGRGDEQKTPLRVSAVGALKGGRARVDGSMSSQVISALLIAAPFADNDTTLEIAGTLVSRPYVDVTLDVLGQAGITVERRGYKFFKVSSRQRFQPGTAFAIHGDYSSSAFLLAAAVLLKSDVTVTDLVEDKQGDKRIIGILRRMGARVERDGNSARVRGPFELKGIDINCRDIPDLVPILTVLGCFAEGRTRIHDIEHLAIKESNRIAQPAGELIKLGANISLRNREIVVKQSRLKSGRVSSWGDHRIAMSLTVAGLRIPRGIIVADAHCISKSYPRFVADMRKLRADIAES